MRTPEVGDFVRLRKWGGNRFYRVVNVTENRVYLEVNHGSARSAISYNRDKEWSFSDGFDASPWDDTREYLEAIAGLSI